MSNFGIATYENRSFAAHRAKNCKSRLQNNQFWNRLTLSAIQNSKKMTVQLKNGQRYGIVKQYETVSTAI
jgi:hypothetical protein